MPSKIVAISLDIYGRPGKKIRLAAISAGSEAALP
jgi:hypothetical protein